MGPIWLKKDKSFFYKTGVNICFCILHFFFFVEKVAKALQVNSLTKSDGKWSFWFYYKNLWVHFWRTFAQRKSKRSLPPRASKTNFAHLPAATHSWYGVMRRMAAGPKMGASAVMVVLHPILHLADPTPSTGGGEKTATRWSSQEGRSVSEWGKQQA